MGNSQSEQILSYQATSCIVHRPFDPNKTHAGNTRAALARTKTEFLRSNIIKDFQDEQPDEDEKQQQQRRMEDKETKEEEEEEEEEKQLQQGDGADGLNKKPNSNHTMKEQVEVDKSRDTKQHQEEDCDDYGDDINDNGDKTKTENKNEVVVTTATPTPTTATPTTATATPAVERKTTKENKERDNEKEKDEIEIGANKKGLITHNLAALAINKKTNSREMNNNNNNK